MKLPLFPRLAILSLITSAPLAALAQLPAEPLTFERGEPQFVHDTWVVDNHWALKTKRQAVTVVFHPPAKHEASPFEIFGADKPSYLWVVQDSQPDGTPLYRMYYQANYKLPGAGEEKGPAYRTAVAYAESRDGITWTKPELNLFPQRDFAKPNNIVIDFPDRPHLQTSAPAAIENLPAKAQKGYRFVMTYRAKGKGNGDIAGIHAVGTHDGIHFDMENDQHLVHLHSDTANTIVYDPAAGLYQLFCRAKQMYRAFGDSMIDTGASRRVATMRSPELWTDWMENHGDPQTLLVPDEHDGYHLYFYGMPTVHRHGIYWGFLECFRLNDLIHTELATSRDGTHWWRHHGRPKLIEPGADGTWDDTMIFGSPAWIETGNEWRFYYAGWDNDHGTSERDGSIGMATALRERIYSRRGPAGGGVVCTRTMTWPGGDLWLNVSNTPDTTEEESAVSVRISGPRRKIREGFDHAQSQVSNPLDDATRQVVRWGEDSERSLNELKGETIRIEFFLQNADLFSFGATTKG